MNTMDCSTICIVLMMIFTRSTNGDVYLTPWTNTTNLTLQTYSFNSLGITHILDYDFVNFTSIQYLKLHHNEISYVSPLAFEGTAILELYINHNKLNGVPDLSSLSGSLRKLEILANNISNIDSSAFSQMGKLKVLFLARNPIVQIAPDAFTGTILEHLVLYKIPLAEWTPLVDLDKLKTLDLRWSQLTSIGSNAFSTMSSLVNVYLQSSYQLSYIDQYAFNATQLNQLNLESCTSMHQLPFLEVVGTTLEKLYVPSTPISTIPDGYLETLPKLSQLNIKSTNIDITNMSVATFANSTALSSLVLEGLSLSGNLSLQLPVSLTTLNFENNDLQSIEPATFQGLSILKEVLGSENKITTFPNMALLPGDNCLEVINLNDNQITTVPSNAFYNLPCLKKLYLKNNVLSEFPNFSFIVDSIVVIDLSGNNIQVVPSARLSDLSFLNNIDLRSNSIQQIPDFTFMINRTRRMSKYNTGDAVKIRLSGNQIETVDVNFAILTEIPIPVTLELGSNNFDVADMPNFYRTLCSRSVITDEQFTLSLVGSDLNCVQDTCWLQTAASTCSSFELVTKEFVCTLPADLNGQLFSSVQLDCPVPGSTCPGSWDRQQWWSVDLKESQLVKHVVVKGRNTHLVADVIVSVSDSANPLEASSVHCSAMCNPPDMVQGVPMDCEGEVDGRFIFVLMRYQTTTGSAQPQLIDISLSDEGYF